MARVDRNAAVGMRQVWMAVLVVVSVLTPFGAADADAGPCPAGFEILVMPNGDLQCAHDDAPPPMTSRSAAFFSAGAEARSLSCIGTGTEGNRLQAVYVTEGSLSLSTADRSAIELGMISTEAIYANSSAAVSDTILVPRWVHGPDCRPSIEVAVVAPGTLADFAATVRAVSAMGFDRPDRKYIMWADSDRLCGIASVSLDERRNNNANDGGQPGYARIDRGCWAHQGSIVAHEVTHTLGAVLPSAPNATPLGHCTDEYDIMCYQDGSGVELRAVCPDRGAELLLDCNNDDYFHPSPPPGSWLHSHWNVADSSFLERMAPTAPVSGFADVGAETPLRGSVEWLAERGVTRGCEEGRFCPDRAVTRGQMAAFLHRFSPGDASAEPAPVFADVDVDDPFAADISWLAASGITLGCRSGDFCPDEEVTRGQMAAFLYRLFAAGDHAAGNPFADVPAGHPFSTEISWLADVGVSNGCGEAGFCPDAPVSRIQMAAFLHRLATALGV